MEHLEDVSSYGARRRPPWLPEYRLWHTFLFVLVTGVAGWYGLYRAIIWLGELLRL